MNFSARSYLLFIGDSITDAGLVPFAIARGGVHPGPHGHMIIARAFLRAFGCLAG